VAFREQALLKPARGIFPIIDPPFDHQLNERKEELR